MKTWTIQKLLKWITGYLTDRGVDSPRLSAEMLLAHALSLKRIDLYTQFDRTVEKELLDRLHALVKRAGQQEPVAYLVGRTEFYSLQINVTRDCMIPRPETELLVERAVEFLRTRVGPQSVCDLCTGSGCIAVAIAANFPAAKIIATDISDAALNVAAANVALHKLNDRITLLCGDLFDPLVPHMDADRFDLIVCNPPYVTDSQLDELEPNIRDYEPRLALAAGADGLDVYNRIARQIDAFLKPDGALILEIGYAQGNAVRKLIQDTGAFTQITVEKDSCDNDRVVTAMKVRT